MWILPTRSRPEWCQRFLDAAEETGMTQKGIIWYDGDPQLYKDLRVPNNWMEIRSYEHLNTSKIFNLLFRQYPTEKFYGFLEDDVIPRTNDWDKTISRAAGDWSGVYVNDGYSQSKLRVSALGGEFVRALGYLSHPEFVHYFADNIMSELVRSLGFKVDLPDVVLEHAHHSNDSSVKKDEVYKSSHSFLSQDAKRYYRWGADEAIDDVKRIFMGRYKKSIDPNKTLKKLATVLSPTIFSDCDNIAEVYNKALAEVDTEYTLILKPGETIRESDKILYQIVLSSSELDYDIYPLNVHQFKGDTRVSTTPQRPSFKQVESRLFKTKKFKFVNRVFETLKFLGPGESTSRYIPVRLESQFKMPNINNLIRLAQWELRDNPENVAVYLELDKLLRVTGRGTESLQSIPPSMKDSSPTDANTLRPEIKHPLFTRNFVKDGYITIDDFGKRRKIKVDTSYGNPESVITNGG